MATQNAMSKPFLFFVVSLGGCTGSSQNVEHSGPIYQKILPGNNLIDLSKVMPIETKYEKINGSMGYSLKKVQEGDVTVFKLFIDFKVNGKSAPDTVYFDGETLGFSRRHFYNAWGDYTGELKFENNILTGELRPESKDSQLDESLLYNKNYEHGVFEPAMLNYVLGALPLEKGFNASLPMLDLNNGSKIIWANIVVEGEEILKLNGKKYDTWKVVSNGSRNKMFWISTEGNYFVKMKNEGVWFQWKISD